MILALPPRNFPNMGSCTWPVDRTCLPEVEPENEVDVAKMQAAVDAAVRVLWSLTGERYACCPRVARPCPSDCETPTMWTPGSGWVAVLDGGVWRNIGCGCGGTCTARGPMVVHLPGPICEITEVRIDDAILDPPGYKQEGDRLYRVGTVWPEQDLQAPLGEDGTWSVQYLTGTPPPAGAAAMVGVIALDFWKVCTTGKCEVPRRVQTVQRQGVTFQLPDISEIIDKGSTGIPLVDMWIASVNPYKHRQRPSVLSPDYTNGV